MTVETISFEQVLNRGDGQRLFALAVFHIDGQTFVRVHPQGRPSQATVTFRVDGNELVWDADAGLRWKEDKVCMWF